MTETTLERRGALEQKGAGVSHWVRRTVAGHVLSAVWSSPSASVFTRVIAARVPEQRATLEKLITDRTGLAVRFDNVHFAWDLDGTSAVFTRVELTDPKAGRVRVVAPELRVEFDTWDFLRHQQFSLGHVTLSSPDIEIIGDPERVRGRRPQRARRAKARAGRGAQPTKHALRAPLPRLGRAHAHRPHRGRRRACTPAAPRPSPRKARAPQLHAEPGGG